MSTRNNHWEKEHMLKYWKTRALSLEAKVSDLEADNKFLHDHIAKLYERFEDSDTEVPEWSPMPHRLQPSHCYPTNDQQKRPLSKSSGSARNRRKRRSKSMRAQTIFNPNKSDVINTNNRENADDDEYDDNYDELVVTVSDEFKKILEDNMRYRMERDAKKKQQTDESETVKSSIINEIENFRLERENASKIMSELYGCYGKQMHAYELAMEMQFNQMKATNKYPYWPTVPLKT